MRKNRGFSLVELIITIAVMAVLVGVLAPQYVKYIEKSRRTTDEKIADELLEMANVIATDEEYYSNLQIGDTIQFDVNGISCTNATIEGQILPEYISGWQGVKVCSKEYSLKCYKIKFVSDAGGNKIAIQVGWE